MLSKQQMVIYVSERRRQKKHLILEALGGKCCICGYDRYEGALELHHLDPSKKEFKISKMMSRSVHAMVEECRGCTILCSCCHKEVHNGIVRMPQNTPVLDKNFTIPKKKNQFS